MQSRRNCFMTVLDIYLLTYHKNLCDIGLLVKSLQNIFPVECLTPEMTCGKSGKDNEGDEVYLEFGA